MNLLEVGLDKLIAILGTDLDAGLTAEQVQNNRREFGENILFEKKNTASDLMKKIFGDILMVLFLLVSSFLLCVAVHKCVLTNMLIFFYSEVPTLCSANSSSFHFLFLCHVGI